MVKNEDKSLQFAKNLMDDFARFTGLTGSEGDVSRRYLWTDAFAVQAFLGLAQAFNSEDYKHLARTLIDEVHYNLGRFHPDDEREGWISGLSESEARENPTAGGLRIGKQLPERKADEAYDQRLEWERDGQYFHYLTRWINALFMAAEETGEKPYASWAAELCLAGSKFIDKSRGRLNMFWKMSTDLSRPLVETRGAHDPLEGLICLAIARQVVSEKERELQPVYNDFTDLCDGQDWATTDALGIGGLLLSTARSVKLSQKKNSLPDSIQPVKLFSESIRGLELFSLMHDPDQAARERLAFRECGLSLGVRCLSGIQNDFKTIGKQIEKIEEFVSLAREIENFWMDSSNRASDTWSEHMGINVVSLAASLIANERPGVFC